MAEKEESRGAALERWDPFRDLDALRGGLFRDLPLLTPRYSNLLGGVFGERPGAQGVAPALDITESDEQYAVSVELPGVSKEDITVDVRERTLSIRGEKKAEREETKESARWSERAYGSFTRSFTLPSDANTERISASFKDGVLKLEIPRAEEAKARSVAIKS